MWPITTRFAASLGSSNHEVVNRLEVLIDGALVLTVEGVTVVDSATGAETGLVDGTVDVDRATIRRRCRIVLADASDVLRPDEVGDLLLPVRSEVRAWRGLMHSDRTTETYPADRELVPVGTFVVETVTVVWPRITITGYDRMWLLDRQRFTAPYTVTRGTKHTDALSQLLAAKIPPSRLQVNLPDLPYTTGLIVWDSQDSPAERAHDLAEAVGLMLYADPMGTFTAQAEPTTDDPPAWSYVEGAGSMVLPWPAEELSAADAENAVVVTGEPQDGTAPVAGYAENTNPASALYAGAVGVIPRFYSSPLITTAGQANLAAQTILAKLGLSDVVALSAVVHPALESGDVIYVQTTHPGGLSAALIADSFQVPLRGAGPQNITTRARTVLS